MVSIERPPHLTGWTHEFFPGLATAASALALHGRPGIVGSRMWQWLTGLPSYAREDSDIDLVIDMLPGPQAGVMQALEEFADRSSLHVDAELSAPEWGEAHWRELASGSPSIMVKSLGGVRLVARAEACAALGVL